MESKIQSSLGTNWKIKSHRDGSSDMAYLCSLLQYDDSFLINITFKLINIVYSYQQNKTILKAKICIFCLLFIQFIVASTIYRYYASSADKSEQGRTATKKNTYCFQHDRTRANRKIGTCGFSLRNYVNIHASLRVFRERQKQCNKHQTRAQ